VNFFLLLLLFFFFFFFFFFFVVYLRTLSHLHGIYSGKQKDDDDDDDDDEFGSIVRALGLFIDTISTAEVTVNCKYIAVTDCLKTLLRHFSRREWEKVGGNLAEVRTPPVLNKSTENYAFQSRQPVFLLRIEPRPTECEAQVLSTQFVHPVAFAGLF
jgi:hypothetical protein